MAAGDTFRLHAMRTWELTDNTVNNYFIEPDFHYTVINLDGTPSNSTAGPTERLSPAATPGAPYGPRTLAFSSSRSTPLSLV